MKFDIDVKVQEGSNFIQGPNALVVNLKAINYVEGSEKGTPGIQIISEANAGTVESWEFTVNKGTEFERSWSCTGLVNRTDWWITEGTMRKENRASIPVKLKHMAEKLGVDGELLEATKAATNPKEFVKAVKTYLEGKQIALIFSLTIKDSSRGGKFYNTHIHDFPTFARPADALSELTELLEKTPGKYIKDESSDVPAGNKGDDVEQDELVV